MRIKSIKLENFMGATERSFTLPETNALVSGKNGSGKTTLMDAHLWLWTDYNSALKNNPPIRPLDGRECIVKVTEDIVLESGEEVQVAKIQKEKRSKPDENGKTRVTGIVNSYEINSVKKTDRDFKLELKERSLDIENNFLALSHPEVFVGQKAADMRKVLFTMAKSHTDAEIAQMTPGCDEVAELLRKYKLDEITAMKKAETKKAKEALERIPAEISGLNKAKVEVDEVTLNAEKTELLQKISEMKATDTVEFDAKIAELRNMLNNAYKDLTLYENEANKEIAEQRVKCLEEIRQAQDKASEAKQNAEKEQRVLDGLKSSGREAVKTKEEVINEGKTVSELKFDYSEINGIQAEKFPENSVNCPTCGRPYPAEKQDELRKNFETNKKMRLENAKQKEADFNLRKETKLAEINDRVSKCNQMIAELKTAVLNQVKVVDDVFQTVTANEKALADAQAKYKALPNGVDVSGDEKYQNIKNFISEKQGQLNEAEAEKRTAVQKNAEVSGLTAGMETRIAEIDKALTAVQFNANCDEKIAQLEIQKRVEGQNQANAERILAQIDAVSKKRNELVSEEINGHFSVVRFKLFDYLKNGEYKEVCVPEVKDGEEWKTIGGSANTALSTIGKVDIVNGLQKFYGQNLPVFIDFAAELDERSMASIKSDMQMILLAVSNGNLEVKGV